MSNRFAAVLVAALSSFAGLGALANETTTITGEFSETHNKLDCNCPPIVWKQRFTVVLSGRGAVHEEWSGVSNRNLTRNSQHEATLGQSAGRATWHVAGPHRIEKTVNWPQHFMRLAITTEGNACRLSVEFRLKPGFSDMFVPRADTGEWSHFSLPQLLDASCEIH